MFYKNRMPFGIHVYFLLNLHTVTNPPQKYYYPIPSIQRAFPICHHGTSGAGLLAEPCKLSTLPSTLNSTVFIFQLSNVCSGLVNQLNMFYKNRMPFGIHVYFLLNLHTVTNPPQNIKQVRSYLRINAVDHQSSKLD
jgi:hypothetical protein